MTRVGTFSPAPGAAPILRQVTTQASMEARLMLRNGEQLLLAVVIPVIVLIGGVRGADRVNLSYGVDTFTPGVLADIGHFGGLFALDLVPARDDAVGGDLVEVVRVRIERRAVVDGGRVERAARRKVFEERAAAVGDADRARCAAANICVVAIAGNIRQGCNHVVCNSRHVRDI